jgi:hypothetical protein
MRTELTVHLAAKYVTAVAKSNLAQRAPCAERWIRAHAKIVILRSCS